MFVPDCPKAGGFTITSTPQDEDGEDGFLELAIQRAPENPPAAWFWKPQSDIEGVSIVVRVGGSFVWPPLNVNTNIIERLVLVAGGVGIKSVYLLFGPIEDDRGSTRLTCSPKSPNIDLEPPPSDLFTAHITSTPILLKIEIWSPGFGAFLVEASKHIR